MQTDPSQYRVGDVWAYRARDYAPSRRVQIVSIAPGKQSVRVEITYLDGPQRPAANVPGSRLPVRWADVEAYDTRMANWQRIDDSDLDDVEDSCLSRVFELLISPDVAELDWSSVKNAAAIRDVTAFAESVGLSEQEVLATGETFELDGMTVVSATGALALAVAACRKNPMPILDAVIEEEAELRHKCKHGVERRSPFGGEKERTSPEWEYQFYLSYHRPRLELLRRWCGHRAITLQERLLSAEAESRRLDLLVTELITALERAGNAIMAEHFDTEHERHRITPERARPLVERPLDPSEIPVREVPRRRRWGG